MVKQPALAGYKSHAEGIRDHDESVTGAGLLSAAE